MKYYLARDWSKHVTRPNIPQLKPGNIPDYNPSNLFDRILGKIRK